LCGTDEIVPLLRAGKPRITPDQLRQGDDEVGDDESARESGRLRQVSNPLALVKVNTSPGGQAETNKGPAG